MIRIPAEGDIVILTHLQAFSIACSNWPGLPCAPLPDLRREVTVLPALTRCRITGVYVEKDGLEFMLETMDREVTDCFMIGPNSLVDGCYPFVVFPPNSAEAAYWHGRVFEALDAQVSITAPAMSPEAVEQLRALWNAQPRWEAKITVAEKTDE
jgi:hypothetical protein